LTNTTFSELGISEPLCRALAAEGYTNPTPIQAQAIPALLEGRDLLGLAQTGSGKTAAFLLPLLQRLCVGHEARRPKSVRSLILAPTRELAIQIDDCLRSYSRFLHLRHAVIVGGVGQNPQIKALAGGLDVLVATPGRLLDHVAQGNVRLDAASVLVLDEADRMFDMGFIKDIRKIVSHLPAQRQSMLFSATMPSDVDALAQSILKRPMRIDITPPKRTAEKIEQRVFFVPTAEKRPLLGKLLGDKQMERVLVFTRTKHTANRVAEHLEKIGIGAVAIHGNKSQNARQRALASFRSGDVRVLVATDIAARGIDIDDVSHVINYELPNEPESYVHRIGRTARAGASGIAISFCDASENGFLRDIETLTRSKIAVTGGTMAPDQPPPAQGRGGQGRGGQGARSHHNSHQPAQRGKPRAHRGARGNKRSIAAAE
jgi:ATP-dependent RNA helicase RhlE